MNENEMLQEQPNCCWMNNISELCELKSTSEKFISEEKKPSLYSLSLTDSVCSESTIDLDACKDQSFDMCSIDNNQSKFESAPIKNNFIGEKLYDSMYDNTEPSGTSATDSANNMNKPLDNKFRKCMSLYDVSNDLALQLSTKSVNTVSCETIHSQSLSSTTKSKDSGFQRSVSCLSLTSGKRNYDHVQSKVKEYIKNIKESEAFRKRNKPFQKDHEMVDQKTVVDEVESVLDKEELLMKIQDLKRELHEKALFIETQQRNNNSLLLKLAEAKNTIDSLRLQKLSLNYSSTNESQNFSSRFDSFDFEAFEEEMNRKWKQTNSSKNMVAKISKCENPTHEQSSISPETSNSSITKLFRPRNHSTPDKNEPSKRLSPVSKIFCSSSRLDKHYKPLTNVRKPSFSCSQSLCNLNGHSQGCQCCLRKKKVSTSEVPISCKSRQSALKPKVNSPGKQKHPHICIDLPNIHPFVKVQEWQASLPSSNLLTTQSSSDFEASDLGVSQSSVLGNKSDKVGKIASPETQNTEEVIDCLLSQELDNKCTISLMEVDSTLDIKTKQNSQTLNHKRPSVNMVQRTVIDNEASKTTFFHGINTSDDNAESHFETIESNHLSFIPYCQSKNDVGRKLVSEKFFKGHSDFPAPLGSQDSLNSDSVSQSYLPKSSSLINTVDKALKSTSCESTDDSSSITSSVLGSNAPSSPPRRSKRRSPTNSFGTSTKLIKLSRNKKRTNFVLREPKLNITSTVPLKNVTEVRNPMTSLNSNFSKNVNTSIKTSLIAESSQRKAWNARNNENFYVFKDDFYVKKSNSIQECFNVMEGMISNGTSIIETALDRSNHQLNSIL